MTDWKSETEKYSKRIEALSVLFSVNLRHPDSIPHGPLDEPPAHLQSVLQRSVMSYKIGVWERSKESLSAINLLWNEGFLCEVASLSRLLFEVWGISNYLTQAIKKYKENENFERLEKISNSIFEGVRSEVLMPWGVPAQEKPIHVMDTIRSLKEKHPQALETYENLCESAHANQPRYFEWWLLGKFGDNWTNNTVQARGHDLLEKTIKSLEVCVSGIKSTTEEGLSLCGQLY